MAWDVTDNLPNKAYFLPDEDVSHALDALWAGVAEFIEARERGEQEQYLTYNAGVFRDLSVRDLLHQLFLSPTVEFGRRMYECEHCGRIMLQAVPDKDDWVYYYPESTKRGILSHEAARDATDGELAATSESWGASHGATIDPNRSRSCPEGCAGSPASHGSMALRLPTGEREMGTAVKELRRRTAEVTARHRDAMLNGLALAAALLIVIAAP